MAGTPGQIRQCNENTGFTIHWLCMIFLYENSGIVAAF